MKIIAVTWLFLIGGLFAAEVEIRSYQIGPSTLREAYWDAVKDHKIDFDKKDWLGPVIQDVPFQSRFLKNSKTVRDATIRVGEMLGLKKFEGFAAYHEEDKKLVVQSKVRWHESLKRHLEHRIVWNLRTEISIYEIPGVTRKKRTFLSLAPPKDAELLTGLTCLHLPGRTYSGQTPSGDLAVEMEGQIDGEDEFAEIRLNLAINHPRASARWKTGFALPTGTFTIHEVGSFDGNNTILAAFKTDLISSSGVPIDNWIEKEKKGFFLLKQRLSRLQYRDFLNQKKEISNQGYCQISVVPTFTSFIMSASQESQSDPFAAEPDNRFKAPYFDPMPPELRVFESASMLDLRELFVKNGVTFRPGDFVAYSELESQLFAKLSDTNMELLDGIITPVGLGSPRNISIDLLEVVLPDSKTQWKPGEGEILRKMSIPLPSGQTTTAQLGANLKAEIDSQIDSYDELLEVGISIFDKGDFEKAKLKSSFTVQNGVPLIIQEKRTSTQRKAWILTARVLVVDHEIRSLIESEKLGR